MSARKKQPPRVVMLVHCPVCGRNDRWSKFAGLHYALYGPCPGEPVEVKYVRAARDAM